MDKPRFAKVTVNCIYTVGVELACVVQQVLKVLGRTGSQGQATQVSGFIWNHTRPQTDMSSRRSSQCILERVNIRKKIVMSPSPIMWCIKVMRKLTPSNAPINVKPHLPPLRQWMGEGGALLAQIWSCETAPWVGLLTRAYLERFRHCA